MAQQFSIFISISILHFLALFMSGEAIKCSMCDTVENGESCRTHPPTPRECSGFNYCLTLAKYSVPEGTLKSFTRSCFPVSVPDACVPAVDKITGESIRVCYNTCARSGCNGSGSLHHLLDLLRRK